MNETEIGRIAAAANQLRPDWPTASLRTLLEKPELASRPRRDVAVAIAWVACESSTKTPARVLEAGPWWQGSTDSPKPREPYDENNVCSVCSQRKDICGSRLSDDHEFLSVARARSLRDEAAAAAETGAVAAREAIRAAREAATPTATREARVVRPRPEFVEPSAVNEESVDV